MLALVTFAAARAARDAATAAKVGVGSRDEVDGKWQAVGVWESRDAFEAFRDERVHAAATATLGAASIDAGPPPAEWFEVKHTLGG